MTAFAPHRDTVESFVDCIHGGADKDVLAGLLAEDVVMYSPLGGEPVTGRDAAVETIRTVNRLAVDDSYEEVLSGDTHHAAHFRLQVGDAAINGIFYVLVTSAAFPDADARHAHDIGPGGRNFLRSDLLHEILAYPAQLYRLDILHGKYGVILGQNVAPA